MSALAIAGLVISVLPLILEGLNAYPDSSVVKLIRAKQEREEFARQLMSVQTGLRYAMERLFIQMGAKLTYDEWQALRTLDVKGSKFFDIWNEILTANPSIVKTNTFAEIEFVLNDMVDKLKNVVANTAIPYDSRSEFLMCIVEKHRTDKSFSTTKGFFKRFMFVAKDHRRRKLLIQMEKYIETLNRLIKEQQLMKKIGPPKNIIEAQESHGPFLDEVRGYCDNLYHALSNIWKCDCHKSPSAMLRLEKRKEPKETDALSFSLLLTFDHYCAQDLRAVKETEICVDQT